MLYIDLDLCALNLGVRRADLSDALGTLSDEANYVYNRFTELRRRAELVPDEVVRREVALAESCLRGAIDQLVWVRRQSNDEGV